jgi:hypothetical protein
MGRVCHTLVNDKEDKFKQLGKQGVDTAGRILLSCALLVGRGRRENMNNENNPVKTRRGIRNETFQQSATKGI